MITEEMLERLRPKKAIKEELGGGYFYRCPWIVCNKIVRSDMNYCPNCGQRLSFDVDNYTREYYS